MGEIFEDLARQKFREQSYAGSTAVAATKAKIASSVMEFLGAELHRVGHIYKISTI